MSLRRRLVVTMVVVVAVGLLVADVITWTSLRSYLYGRVDSQLTSAAHQVAAYQLHAVQRGEPMTTTGLRERISPDVYVMVLDRDGVPMVTRPSGTSLHADPRPALPHPLPVGPLPRSIDGDDHALVYRPASSAVTVSSSSRPPGTRRVEHGPDYRLLAVSLPGSTLVVATRLDSVEATLDSLRAIELGLTVGVLCVLVVLIAVVVRRGLRPIEDMSREADAIAEGDLTRRVHPDDGDSEISRLGRALNGMLTQIETAFAQRAGSEERLRSFLADASHELRTPLTSIQGYAELLRKDALPDPDARDRALARIEQEAARMGVLVGDLAVLARQGEGPAPELVPIDLAALVGEVVADARAIDGTRPLQLDAPDPVPVLADATRLEQLVLNLVANARAHTPAGTPIEVRVSAEGDKAVLVVRDHGPGLDDDQAARVFDRFYRGGSARDTGSGLGLFIVATLARTFGGEASVVSSPGEGAAFTVVLPLDRTAGPGRAPSPDDGAGSARGEGTPPMPAIGLPAVPGPTATGPTPSRR